MLTITKIDRFTQCNFCLGVTESRPGFEHLPRVDAVYRLKVSYFCDELAHEFRACGSCLEQLRDDFDNAIRSEVY